MVRTRPRTHDALRRLAEETGRTQADLLDEAVELLEREQFLTAMNESFLALRADQDAWSAEVAEREDWDGALGDDLGDS